MSKVKASKYSVKSTKSEKSEKSVKSKKPKKSVKSVKSVKSKKPETIETTEKPDSIDIEIRSQSRESLRECMINYPMFLKLTNRRQKWLINKIESSIHNANINQSITYFIQAYWNNVEFVNQYSTIAFDVKTNLDIESSILKNKPKYIQEYLPKGLCLYALKMDLVETSKRLAKLDKNILNNIFKCAGAIDPSRVGFMSYIELNPYLSQKQIKDIKIRSNQKIKWRSTKQYKCGECGANDASQRKQQTRGLDEAKTIFLKCNKCGHRWRF